MEHRSVRGYVVRRIYARTRTLSSPDPTPEPPPGVWLPVARNSGAAAASRAMNLPDNGSAICQE